MARCEQLVQDAAARSAGTPWPPSYAEFIGYCKPQKEPKEPNEPKYFAKALPEPDEVKQKRRETGKKQCERLLGMFD